MEFWERVIENQMQGMDTFSAYNKAVADEHRNEPVYREIRFLGMGDLSRFDTFIQSYNREADANYQFNFDFDDIKETIEDDRDCFMGAIENGNVVGIIYVANSMGIDNMDKNSAWLTDLYVIPERRDNGIGSELVNRAIEYAKEKYGKKIYAYTELNKSLSSYYERFGFKEERDGQMVVSFEPKTKIKEREQIEI